MHEAGSGLGDPASTRGRGAHSDRPTTPATPPFAHIRRRLQEDLNASPHSHHRLGRHDRNAVSTFWVAKTNANRAVSLAFGDGVVRVKTDYPLGESITRMQQDIAAKGIMMFSTIDQAKLAADAGTALRPSTLLVFGNPALGSQFITSKAVRLLVQVDESGQVWAIYTDFDWMARRHRITDRQPARGCTFRQPWHP